MQIIAARSDGPSLLESPDNLRIHAPIMEGLGHRKRLVGSTPCLVTAIHRFRLPFHEWKAGLRLRRFPFIEQVSAVDLGAGVGTGFVRAECSRNTGQNGLGRTKIEGIFPARNVNKIPQVARLTI